MPSIITNPPCLNHTLPSMSALHNKKGSGVAEIKIREEEVKEDEMVVSRRYANLARSLDMPYSLGNIGLGKQATHEAHRSALG